MRLTGERLRLGQGGNRSRPWRIVILLALIAGGIALLRLRETGDVQPLFLATPTTTRTAATFREEGEAHFSAGDLEGAISAYRRGVKVDSSQADLWAEMARVQTYSSDLLTTLDERRTRLAEARESVEQAVNADPDSAFAHAVKALVYDWSASAELIDAISVGDRARVQAAIGEGGLLTAQVIELPGSIEADQGGTPSPEEAILIFTGVVEEIGDDAWVVGGRTLIITSLTLVREANRREAFLAEARTAAVRARELDPSSSLALAFLAEVRVDQQNVALAADLAQRAAETVGGGGEDPRFQMDVHRVYGTVLEHQGLYLRAIEEYKEAAAISPNLTFLYLKIGANYRTLRDVQSALRYFDQAARINDQLGIKDPTPYLAIGRTYQQDGEFFIAAINIERALAIDPANPDIYARLGSVYFQARNYESAIPVLKCGVSGCTAEESGDLMCELGVFRCDPGSEMASEIGTEVRGMPLGSDTVEYYYTYGSALTFYAGEEAFPHACQEAEAIFSQLMTKYGDNPLVAAIVAEGRLICLNPGTTPEEPISTPTPLPNPTS